MKNNFEYCQVLVGRVNDVLEFRVDSVLKEMTRTKLCEIPEDEPFSVEDFVNTTSVSLKHFSCD